MIRQPPAIARIGRLRDEERDAVRREKRGQRGDGLSKVFECFERVEDWDRDFLAGQASGCAGPDCQPPLLDFLLSMPWAMVFCHLQLKSANAP